MHVYRAVLVWVLRCSAVGAMAMTVWNVLEARRAYDVVAERDPVEAAGMMDPAMPALLVAGLAAAVLFTLAEILALLSKRDSS